MVQSDINDLLENSKCPYSANEIAKLLDVNINIVFRAIEKMIKYDEIKFVELPSELAMKFYKIKRKMRLFYK